MPTSQNDQLLSQPAISILSPCEYQKRVHQRRHFRPPRPSGAGGARLPVQRDSLPRASRFSPAGREVFLSWRPLSLYYRPRPWLSLTRGRSSSWGRGLGSHGHCRQIASGLDPSRTARLLCFASWAFPSSDGLRMSRESRCAELWSGYRRHQRRRSGHIRRGCLEASEESVPPPSNASPVLQRSRIGLQWSTLDHAVLLRRCAVTPGLGLETGEVQETECSAFHRSDQWPEPGPGAGSVASPSA
jgi:hypothetical protein